MIIKINIFLYRLDQYLFFFISVPPSIQIIPPNGQITTRKGGPVSFECRANGNPPPTVQWSKKVSEKKKLLHFSYIREELEMLILVLDVKSLDSSTLFIVYPHLRDVAYNRIKFDFIF